MHRAFADPFALINSAMDALSSESFLEFAEHCDDASLALIAGDLVIVASDSSFAGFRANLGDKGIVATARPRDPEHAERDVNVVIFAAWAEWNSPRRQIEALIGARAISAELGQRYCTPHPPPRPLTIIGVLGEGDDAAHI